MHFKLFEPHFTTILDAFSDVFGPGASWSRPGHDLVPKRWQVTFSSDAMLDIFSNY